MFSCLIYWTPLIIKFLSKGVFCPQQKEKVKKLKRDRTTSIEISIPTYTYTYNFYAIAHSVALTKHHEMIFKDNNTSYIRNKK